MKIEVTKGSSKFTFKQAFANDLFEYQINHGEASEKLLELQDRLKSLDGKDDAGQEIRTLLTKVNLGIVRLKKLTFSFAISNLLAVESTDPNITLAAIQEMKVPMEYLDDVLSGYIEAAQQAKLNKQESEEEKKPISS